MKKIKRLKAKVTSSKWRDGEDVGKVISLPEFLKERFIRYGYGEIVKETPEDLVKPEEKKKGRKPKTKE